MSDPVYLVNPFSNYPTSTITLKSNLPSFAPSTVSLQGLSDVISVSPLPDGAIPVWDSNEQKFVIKSQYPQDGGTF